GIVHSLTKPAKAHELLQTLQNALGLRQDRSTNQGSNTFVLATRPLRVLVADDSPVNREVAAGMLELRGHDVRTVTSGREAVEAWERDSFDVILMDVEMHEMDGLTATVVIRRREAETGERIPIFALSAHAAK